MLVEPDNWQHLHVFLAMKTQWRIISGMGGVHYQGLEYSALPSVLSLMSVPKAERSETFAALRIMESSALSVLNVKKD